ncbi:MAG: spore coat associated protein CotJA [Oscillospiraceae bacterium]|nr:spore coat associated protein CotJA [Oscillospiraceae bacterium]
MINNYKSRAAGGIEADPSRRPYLSDELRDEIKKDTEMTYAHIAPKMSGYQAKREHTRVAAQMNSECMNRNKNSEFDLEFVPAISYVPWQQWSEIMDPQEGLMNGTIFYELVKPFKGYQIGR